MILILLRMSIGKAGKLSKAHSNLKAVSLGLTGQHMLFVRVVRGFGLSSSTTDAGGVTGLIACGRDIVKFDQHSVVDEEKSRQLKLAVA